MNFSPLGKVITTEIALFDGILFTLRAKMPFFLASRDVDADMSATFFAPLDFVDM